MEDLEKALILDQGDPFADFDSSLAMGVCASTQRLLDNLLGRLEVDDSAMCLTHSFIFELDANFDE